MTPGEHGRGDARIPTELRPYPIDMSQLSDLPPDALDEVGVLHNAFPYADPAGYHPARIASLALAHWNDYLSHGRDPHREAFMNAASRLVENELRLSDAAGRWPVPFAYDAYHAYHPWLSASIQGCVTSVLVRAYQLSGEEAYFRSALRAVRTIELDILDGGVSAQLAENEVFFEGVAVYPAAHILNGHLLALLGLYDYLHLTQDGSVEALAERGIASLRSMIAAFDTGYWTRYDLLRKRLASRFCHSLHASLLEALAAYSGCEHLSTLAAKWARYQNRTVNRMRYFVVSRVAIYYDRDLKPALRRILFRTGDTGNRARNNRVCVPITRFPVPGGMRGVLTGVARVMRDEWQMTYLTNDRGPDAEGLEIEVFGSRTTSPWKFPFVWFYCLAGWGKLFSLLRSGADYDLILPQDGVFTAAFAVLVGKLAGVRVVCMDHGNMTWLDNRTLREERLKALEGSPLAQRFSLRLLYHFYWPSLRVLASVATRWADQFLVAGDEVEEVYRRCFGVRSDRIIRYAYIVDVDRFARFDGPFRVSLRGEQGIAADAVLITMINRLATGKGVEVALEGIALALSALPVDLRPRVKVLIAGDGPLRSEIEADIRRRGLEATCILRGEVKPSDAAVLLGVSDIFLYSGTRGTNYSMAVLEAMSAGCAVVATVSPRSNARLLAEGRGAPIAVGSADEIGNTLSRLCSDPALCLQMGQSAREYIIKNHTTRTLKRSLSRASFFAPSV